LAEQRKRAERERADLAAALKAVTAELQRAREETRAVQEELKKRDGSLLQRIQETERLRQQLIAAETQARLMQERATSLLQQLQKQRPGAKRAPAPAGGNPPEVPVKGAVLKVSPKEVVVSVGADSGLKVGHTLEVYRLKPRPEYVGRIRIVDVAARMAVGRL